MFILPFPNMTIEASFLFSVALYIEFQGTVLLFVCLLVSFWPLILVDSSIAKSRIRATQCIIKNKSNV